MYRTFKLVIALTLLLVTNRIDAQENSNPFKDASPQRYDLSVRASEIDKRAKAYTEISFLLEKDGKPQDLQHASVDTRVKPQAKLMIWLMGPNPGLFERVNSYGIHAIRVHYANGWFGKFGNDSPGDDGELLGDIRLEAATGDDVSPLVNIAKRDSIEGRAYQMIRWLIKSNPQGRWDVFLTDDRREIRWDRVILSGASHGSTTAARFAKHQKVARVVMLCGPRDQLELWQSLPSATPENCYFGFSHVLDDGWSGDHYCRSWEMLGMQKFGEVVNVEKITPPFNNTRRLITDADVKGDSKRAHSSVQPGGSAIKSNDGTYLHEAVWSYMFNHPVETVGQPTSDDPDCKH